MDAGNTLASVDLSSWHSFGTSYTIGPAAIPTAPKAFLGQVRLVDGLQAVSSLRATLDAPKTIQWLPKGATGATFCLVAKLPATVAANSNQVLLDLPLVLMLSRSGTGSSMDVMVGSGKAVTLLNAFDNKWHVYVITTTGTSTVVYIDGVQKQTQSHASIAPGSAAVQYFGTGSKVPTAMLTGEVRQIMAWRRLLNATELAALRRQLVARWKL